MQRNTLAMVVALIAVPADCDFSFMGVSGRGPSLQVNQPHLRNTRDSWDAHPSKNSRGPISFLKLPQGRGNKARGHLCSQTLCKPIRKLDHGPIVVHTCIHIVNKS